MNIPEVYLIEPYNAYTAQKGGRKKHFMEILEEQELMQRIIAEAEGRRITQHNNTNNNVSNTGHTATATAAGFDHVSIVTANFQVARRNSGSNAAANTVSGSLTGSLATPLIVTFTNLTSDTAPKYPVSYKWTFGDGTTSTFANPTHSYSTGSFSVKLEATSSYSGAGNSSAVTRLAVSCSL
jgi:hypothetical protein